MNTFNYSVTFNTHLNHKLTYNAILLLSIIRVDTLFYLGKSNCSKKTDYEIKNNTLSTLKNIAFFVELHY